MTEMLQEALRLRKLGFAIHWLIPGEKRPVESGWADDLIKSAEDLKKSYRPGFNVGFRPGKWSVVKGREICVLDIDIRGGAAFAEEAYCAAAAMLGDKSFDVVSGSGVGRHRYLAFPIGASPQSAATTLRQSDVYIDRDGKLCSPGAEGARPAWLIELLSTGKNVVLPPSIHPDTQQPYQFTA